MIKLTEMNFAVSQPVIDTLPYDLIADWNGRLTRLQVKSTRTMSEGRRYKLEAVNGCDRTAYEQGSIDYIIGYIEPEDQWYVIPHAAVDAKKITLYPHIDNSTGKYECYREQWVLLK
jgi:hypothetical protein